ncbi:MAG TPA: DUF5134 domain-containing protein [Streptosporangiaceae bacterium]|jgi:hypothetical protein
MTGLSWIPDAFAAIMIVVAVVSAARLAAAAYALRWGLTVDSDADAAHVLMAIAMAGMLTASLHTLPNVVWEVVFALVSVWFIGRVAREERGRGLRGWAVSCHSPHLVHSMAMVYMFTALITPGARPAGTGAAGSGGMAMGGGAGPGEHVTTLALVLILVLAGYTVRDLDRLTDPVGLGFHHPVPASPRRSAARQPALATASGPAPAVAGAAMAPAATAMIIPAPYGENESPGHHDVPDRILAPRLATVCRIAMGVTMAYMLVIMI